MAVQIAKRNYRFEFAWDAENVWRVSMSMLAGALPVYVQCQRGYHDNSRMNASEFCTFSCFTQTLVKPAQQKRNRRDERVAHTPHIAKWRIRWTSAIVYVGWTYCLKRTHKHNFVQHNLHVVYNICAFRAKSLFTTMSDTVFSAGFVIVLFCALRLFLAARVLCYCCWHANSIFFNNAECESTNWIFYPYRHGILRYCKICASVINYFLGLQWILGQNSPHSLI